jgi:hypothetical protein
MGQPELGPVRALAARDHVVDGGEREFLVHQVAVLHRDILSEALPPMPAADRSMPSLITGCDLDPANKSAISCEMTEEQIRAGDKPNGRTG